MNIVDVPGTGAMRDGTFSSICVQLGSQMPQSCPWLDHSNISSIIEIHIMHAIQLDDEMSTLSTQPPGDVAMASSLGRDTDSMLSTAIDSALDLRNGCGNCYSGRVISRYTGIEACSVIVPVE